MKNIVKIFLFLIPLSYCCSCKKFVEIAPPNNQLENSAIFSDSANATAAIRGIYIAMMQNFALNLTSGGLAVYSGMSADELSPTTQNVEEQDFYNNTLIANNSLNNMHFWSHGSRLIYQANACIEGINNAENIPAAVKAKLTGEAFFIRAFVYFYLTNLYGPVPLSASTEYHSNMLLARAPVESVYTQIIKDLNVAETNLPVSYPSSGRFRPNYYTAEALLSRVFLYQQKWVEAENRATNVINSGLYTLETDLNKVFLANNNESIWKLSPVFDGKETWEGYFMIPSTATSLPKYILTDGLINAFEPGDKRKTAWTNKNLVSGLYFYYPFKYKLRATTTTPQESNIVFRLAELYLIRAEARAQQNNITGAFNDLNVLRRRAGLSDLPSTLNQEQVLKAVSQERRVELFCEWGHRWLDLKRTSQATAILQPLKSNWKVTDTLYPVPESELETNPFLVQNSGY
jgi:starch-binding outer membrane protein, SusD/RagB family